MPLINREPRQSIVNGRDPITGKKLVRLNGGLKRWQPNKYIQKVRSGDEEKVENYLEAKKDDFKGWRLHHRLELTLDNEDACSMMDLINFGMYYHRPYFELIWLRIEDHNRLHSSTHFGQKNSMYGKLHTEDSKRLMSEMHRAMDLTGERSSNWKGESAGVQAKYKRGLNDFRAGKITEEELQPLRDAWIEYKRINRNGGHKKCVSLS